MKRARRNPARWDERVEPAFKELASDTGSMLPEVFKVLDRRSHTVLVLTYLPNLPKTLFSLMRYTWNSDPKKVVHEFFKFRNLYDAIEAYKHWHQRLWPALGYTEKRRRQLADQEHPPLPNPARPDKKIVQEMTDFAKSVGRRMYNDELQRYIISDGNDRNLVTISLIYAPINQGYWTPENWRRFAVRVRGDQARPPAHGFDNLYDAWDYFLKLRQRYWPKAGYAKRRIKALSEQERPKLPEPTKR